MKKKILPVLLASVVTLSTLQQPLVALGEELTDNQQVEVDDSTTTTEPEAPVEEPIEPQPVEPSEPQPEEPTAPTTPEQPTENNTSDANDGSGTTTTAPAENNQADVPSADGTSSLELPPVSVPVPQRSSQSSDIEITVIKNQTTEEFIRSIGEKARRVGQEKNLYASVMIAQAILESGSGGSQLSQEPNHNLFGIKGDYEGEAVTFNTQEDDGEGNLYTIEASFKKYPSYKESFEDYAELLTEGITGNPEIYKGTWKDQTESYEDATEALTGVYATDTHYGQKLNKFIEEYKLTEYDKPAPESNGTFILADHHADSDFEEYNGASYPGSEFYAAGNCTQYAYNRVAQLGGFVEINMGNGMDWGATGRANNYKVSSEPKAGTAVSFAPGVAGADGTYGHVAFVEHVYEDGSILISEMNALGQGVVSFRILTSDVAKQLDYITPK